MGKQRNDTRSELVMKGRQAEMNCSATLHRRASGTARGDHARFRV